MSAPGVRIVREAVAGRAPAVRAPTPATSRERRQPAPETGPPDNRAGAAAGTGRATVAVLHREQREVRAPTRRPADLVRPSGRPPETRPDSAAAEHEPP